MTAPSTTQILDYLSAHHIRATYGAVGKVLGVPTQSVGQALGLRSPRASWVVNAATGKPSGYQPHQLDPAFTTDTVLIHTAEDLLHRMASSA